MPRAFKPGLQLAALVVAGLGLGCTFSPQLPEGKISCLSASDCPAELRMCVAGSCHGNSPITPPSDAGPPDSTGADHTTSAVDAAADTTGPADTAAETKAVDAPGDARDAVPDAVSEKGAPGCADADLISGLLVFLPLDDNSRNPVVADDAPGAIEALVKNLDSGATWTPGRFGTGLSLAGGQGGAWISVGGNPTSVALNNIAGGFSISLWAKFPAGKPANGVLFSRRDEGGKGYLILISVSNGRLRAQLYTSNGNFADVTGNQTLPTDGRWMHVAVTYGSGGPGLDLFINGVSVGRDPLFALQLAPQNTPILLGAAEDPLALLPSTTIINQLHGALDDVAVFARKLPVNAVKALACGARPQP